MLWGLKKSPENNFNYIFSSGVICIIIWLWMYACKGDARMNSFLRTNKRFIVFLSVLAFLYVAIITLNALSAYQSLSNLFKYAGVAVCFFMALAAYPLSFDNRDAKLLSLALAFTLAADAFLIFVSAPELGVVCFFAAHLLYIKRYKRKSFKRNCIVALSATAFSLAGYLSGLDISYILLLGAVYAYLIFTATGLAFRSALPKINKRLAEIGMVLFLLCDLNVAVGFLVHSGNPLSYVAGILEWMFYIPSQALLALSGIAYLSPPKKQCLSKLP